MKRPTWSAACVRWSCSTAFPLRFWWSTTPPPTAPAISPKALRGFASVRLSASISFSSMSMFSMRPSRCREGWTGKANALVAAEREAQGEWLLFTDADTEHLEGSLAAAVAEAERAPGRSALLLARAAPYRGPPASCSCRSSSANWPCATARAASAILRCPTRPPTANTCSSAPPHISRSAASPRSPPNCSKTWPWPAATSSRAIESASASAADWCAPACTAPGRSSRRLDQKPRAALSRRPRSSPRRAHPRSSTGCSSAGAVGALHGLLSAWRRSRAGLRGNWLRMLP